MKFKRAGIVIIAIVLILVVFAGIRLSTINDQIDRASENNQKLQEQLNALTQENAELQYELDHSEDPEMIEDIAREKLGLVKPGEKVFVDLNN